MIDLQRLQQLDSSITRDYVINFNKAVADEMEKTNWGTRGHDVERLGKVTTFEEWVSWIRDGFINDVYYPQVKLTDNMNKMEELQLINLVDEIVFNLPITIVARAKFPCIIDNLNL